MRSEGGFPWPIPEFTPQRSPKPTAFEVSLFQSGQVEFLVPEALYLWRQVSLEAARRQNYGNPEGVKLYAFYAASSDDSIAEDAYLVRHPCKAMSVDGIFILHDQDGNKQVHFEPPGQETDLHFRQCGYNSIFLRWEDESEDRACPWELNVASMPVGDVPVPPTISETAQVQLIETLSELMAEDPRVKTFFLSPVDTRTYSDYNLMVEVPMDLSLVRKRLENSYYSNLQSFMADIKLIIQNCCKYNDERSEIVQVAMELYQSFSVVVKDIETKEQATRIDRERIQNLLQEKVNSLHLPTREAQDRTIIRRSRRESRPTEAVAGENRRTRNSLGVPRDASHVQPLNRGRNNGALNNLAAARIDAPYTLDSIANRTRHSSRVAPASRDVSPPSRSSRRKHSSPTHDPKLENEEDSSDMFTDDSTGDRKRTSRTRRGAASQKPNRKARISNEASHSSLSDQDTRRPENRPRRGVIKKSYVEPQSDDEADLDDSVSEFEEMRHDDEDHDVEYDYANLSHLEQKGRNIGRSLRSGNHTRHQDREQRSTRGRKNDEPAMAPNTPDSIANRTRRTARAEASSWDAGSPSRSSRSKHLIQHDMKEGGVLDASVDDSADDRKRTSRRAKGETLGNAGKKTRMKNRTRDRLQSNRTTGGTKKICHVPASGNESEYKRSESDFEEMHQSDVEDNTPQVHGRRTSPRRNRTTSYAEREFSGDSGESDGSDGTHRVDQNGSNYESSEGNEKTESRRSLRSGNAGNARVRIQRRRTRVASDDESEKYGASDSESISRSKPKKKRKRSSQRALIFCRDVFS